MAWRPEFSPLSPHKGERWKARTHFHMHAIVHAHTGTDDNKCNFLKKRPLLKKKNAVGRKGLELSTCNFIHVCMLCCFCFQFTFQHTKPLINYYQFIIHKNRLRLFFFLLTFNVFQIFIVLINTTTFKMNTHEQV